MLRSRVAVAFDARSNVVSRNRSQVGDVNLQKSCSPPSLGSGKRHPASHSSVKKSHEKRQTPLASILISKLFTSIHINQPLILIVHAW